MTSLRLVFMGSPDFSVPILDALMAAGHEIVCVYSQPPRPAGRGHKEVPSPVHASAEAKGLDVRTPISLKGGEEQAAFAALKADAAVVAAYGLLLPKAVVEAPKMGCLNVHASLLPRWRGAAPIQRAILGGDIETGVSIMVIDEGLDTGDVLLTGKILITTATTAGSLHDELSGLGARLMVEALAGLAAGNLTPKPQAADGVTYAQKLTRDEGRLDWRLAAVDLERRVRALNPWPGVWFEHAGDRIKVLAAVAEEGKAGQPPGVLPGVLIDGALGVACGEGVLRLTRVQRAGKEAQDGETFVLGYPLGSGTQLD
ncbi:MAG: methionyl-tRNA formyltransferase [Rhodospirillales bacterium]|nr:methionyl-tRNA formyltransferase [Rhodospirillales bacterium]